VFIGGYKDSSLMDDFPDAELAARWRGPLQAPAGRAGRAENHRWTPI